MSSRLCGGTRDNVDSPGMAQAPARDLPPLPETQRAAVVHAFAASNDEVAASVRVVGDHPAPGEVHVAKDQVMVRVHAAAVNAVDYRTAAGFFQIPGTPKPPYVPGFDLAGEVVRVGAACTRVKVGDLVWGTNSKHGGGTFCDYAVVKEDWVAAKPPSLTFAEAAALPDVFLTSLQGLEAGACAEGDRVLVLGGSGGCGSAAVQLARALGAREVVATCSARNDELVRGLGADRTVDYTAGPWWEALDGAGFDLVFDAVGDPNAWPQRKRVLAQKGGRFVAIADDTKVLTFGRLLGILGSIVARKVRAALPGSTPFSFPFQDPARPDQLDRLAAWVEGGAVRPVVDRRFALEDAGAALAHQATGHARGKVVVLVSPRADERE